MAEYRDLDQFRGAPPDLSRGGPVAVCLAEDAVELDGTLAHLARLGFRTILLMAPGHVQTAAPLPGGVIRVGWRPGGRDATVAAVNAVIDAAPGQWIHYTYNAEYLFYPFCETRSVAELLAFHAEERRDAMLTYVVDLYAADLDANPNGVSPTDAHLDQSGYYATGRPDPANHNHPKDRQLDFFGGLRWRLEEHVPEDSRRIDRIGIFRAKPGLQLRPDHTLTDEEMNTYACPWHNNLTAAICSFRAAKALRTNPGSRWAVSHFTWHNSVRFDWDSQQLLDLGLIEPGQWF
ncbi:hypothetical protein SAMN04488012_11062 [Palleronia salina]|uniref:Uncharacterized protein n=1 Tax=Palleronia salina TaxID=313368 RepID=A0A1M6JQ63_9RHOB|nr:hypothetical protein [Palleronia salina]SHJ48786.1 hypothetical protein SAMN04488012_11062 [Palleronia salina]